MKRPKRRKSRPVSIGNVVIGGGGPVVVQSMCNTPTSRIDKTIEQAIKLHDAGAKIVRIAVKDEKDAACLKEIKRSVDFPLVADIHFDHRLAITAIESGFEGIRINPGNIGSKKKVEEIIRVAKDASCVIRIGLNSGSIKDVIRESSSENRVKALIDTTLRYIRLFEDLDFRNIKISIKSVDVLETVEANLRIAELVDYPLHVGITEAGTLLWGTMKSAAGIGVLLWHGVVDTIRVSLTEDPIKEVSVAKELVNLFYKDKEGLLFISCPTCGRTDTEFLGVARSVEERLRDVLGSKRIKVAVMGCEVNGPGEAMGCDFALVSSRRNYIFYSHGKPLTRLDKKITPEGLADRFVEFVLDNIG